MSTPTVTGGHHVEPPRREPETPHQLHVLRARLHPQVGVGPIGARLVQHRRAADAADAVAVAAAVADAGRRLLRSGRDLDAAQSDCPEGGLAQTDARRRRATGQPLQDPVPASRRPPVRHRSR